MKNNILAFNGKLKQNKDLEDFRHGRIIDYVDSIAYQHGTNETLEALNVAISKVNMGLPPVDDNLNYRCALLVKYCGANYVANALRKEYGTVL